DLARPLRPPRPPHREAPGRDARSALPGAAGARRVVPRPRHAPREGARLVAGASGPRGSLRLRARAALLAALALGREQAALGLVGHRRPRPTAVLRRGHRLLRRLRGGGAPSGPL